MTKFFSKIFTYTRQTILLAQVLVNMAFTLMHIRRVINELKKQLVKERGAGISKSFQKRLSAYMFGGYYYGLVFARLHGRKLMRRERYCLFMAGAFLCTGDFLFDDEAGFPHSRILDIIRYPENYVPVCDKDSLLLNIYNRLLSSSLSTRGDIITALSAAYEANVESELQKAAITNDEARSFTYKKGSSCGVFYRACLNYRAVANEYEAAGALGELGQLIDDAFDIYQDKKNKLATIFSVEDDITIIIAAFKNHRDLAYQKLLVLDLPARNRKKAIETYNMVANVALFFLYHLKINVARQNDISHITSLAYKDVQFRFSIKNIISLFSEHQTNLKV